MKCLVLANSEQNSKVIDHIYHWLSFDSLETKWCDSLPCVTAALDYDKVLIILNQNQQFINSVLKAVEYFNNINIPTLFFIIDSPILPPSLRYFLSDKPNIKINSSKDINNQLFGLEFHFN